MTRRRGTVLVTGDTVNTAARLEQAAPPGEILLGRLTSGLVRDAVNAEPVEPIAAKGKAEPLEAYRLDRGPGRCRGPGTALRRADGRAGQGARRPDRGLAAGRGRADPPPRHPRRPGGGQQEPPGPGVHRAGPGRPWPALVGRCLCYGEGITYWPVRELVPAAAGGHGGGRSGLRAQRSTAGRSMPDRRTAAMSGLRDGLSPDRPPRRSCSGRSADSSSTSPPSSRRSWSSKISTGPRRPPRPPRLRRRPHGGRPAAASRDGPAGAGRAPAGLRPGREATSSLPPRAARRRHPWTPLLPSQPEDIHITASLHWGPRRRRKAMSLRAR